MLPVCLFFLQVAYKNFNTSSIFFSTKNNVRVIAITVAVFLVFDWGMQPAMA
jgi:hypothetical protein